MAYEFKKLSEVEVLTEVPEGASVLAEVNGDIKRVPGAGLGGNGVKTIIVKSSDYDAALTGQQERAVQTTTVTYECVNMTFEEAHEIIIAGEPLNCTIMLVNNGDPFMGSLNVILADYTFGIPCVVLVSQDLCFFWTADGISTEEPSNGK